MEMLKQLKEQGWYLTEEGLKKITDAETPGTDVKKIIAAALNWDFREIAGGALPTKREETLPGRIVLQVQKIRNLAAPKANEESKTAPRFLQIDFSDGQTLLQGLELEPIPTLSLNVAPGTKVYLRAECLELMQGFAVLKAANVQVLGGRVEQLAEKWELARTMMKYARSGRRISGSSGPPPWIAFGKKLEVKDSLDTRNFKSLQPTTDKDKDASKENEEFKAMRTEAIAEAAKAGSKKVFGGGNQQIIDHNVKKILEKGYNEEDAKQALRSTNNNLERALYNLKRRDDYKRNEDRYRNSVESAPATGRSARGAVAAREFGGKRGAASVKEEASAAKPAANVSLFDFLTEKLPANAETVSRTETPTTAATLTSSKNNTSNSKFEKSKSDIVKSSQPSKTQQDSSSSSTRPKFENNLSSSFAANRTPGGPRTAGRSEREPYNATERQSSSRYSSASGRGGRGGRGGGFQSGNRASYEEGNNRGGYQQRRETGGGAGTERNANSNNNSTNTRNNRNSHERSTAATTQSGNDKNQTQTAGGYENRRQPQDYQNKGHDRSRYNQKEQSNNSVNNNRQYENNSNRRESSYNAGNNSSKTTATATAANANNNNNNNQNNSNNSEHAARMNKLVESTSKMKIEKTRDSGRNQQRQQNQRQQQQQQYSTQQQQAQQMPAVQQYSAPAPHQLHQQMLMNNQAQPNYGQQLANGFSYDPSKIIGFQNKETNEFAMTLLKSQGLAASTASQQPPTTATHYMQPSAAPLQMPQQQQQPFAKPAAFVLPTVQPTAPPSNATNYGMMQPAESWMWKIGDICLAKYWDDGRYYEAEITGVSDKTCVVFFRGYGNHEEVLQSDCLPITDANHRPINHYNNPNQQQQQLLAAALQQQQTPAPPPNMHLNNSTQNRAVPNRYRGERQVYVPPPKRDN